MLGQMMHRPLSIIEILKFAAEAHPRAEMVSVRTEGDIHRQTYADSLRRVGQLAHALKKLGVAPGARIATLAWNGYRHFELYYAISGHTPCGEPRTPQRPSAYHRSTLISITPFRPNMGRPGLPCPEPLLTIWSASLHAFHRLLA